MRKTTLSWLAAGLGLLFGFLALARFGMAWPPSNDDWLPRWIGYGGAALLGPVFLAGSVVALRNRKGGGIIFLICMPVIVFGLAYQSAGYLVWHSDGGGWFEVPEIPTAIGLTTIFFLPVFAALLAIRYRRRAVYLFGATVVLAWIVFAVSRWTKAFLLPFGGWSALFLLFGLFWLGTGDRGWPSLLQPRSRPLSQRVAALVFTCILALCVDVVATLGLSALGSSLFSGDCRGKPPIVHPESPYHAVFTARVIFVGRSIEAFINGRGIFRDPKFTESRDPRVGDWAVGVVQEKFWGLPSWSRLVLLTNFIYWKDATYFVDGSRGRGLLSHALPIVDGRTNCSRTKPVQDSHVDLRALRGPSSASGTHLMGYIREAETFVRGLAPPSQSKYAGGVKINITGPTGSRIITTDQSGVYQVDDLPPGDYTLQLLIPESKVAGFWKEDGSPAKVHLDSHELVERSFDLFWNGRIEGHVTDDSGKAVQASVTLLSANGTQLPGYVQNFILTDPDGSYQIKRIPAGRYKVMIDSSGREYRWPSEVQFYPSKSHTEDAQVLELSEGQRIMGIDFKVPHLTEKTVQVRVTLPNGSAVEGAQICIAYEHTEDYEPLEAKHCSKETAQDGLAVIHVYGNARVRVFAQHSVYEDKAWAECRSHPVESEANKMPAKIDLVLTPLKPFAP